MLNPLPPQKSSSAHNELNESQFPFGLRLKAAVVVLGFWAKCKFPGGENENKPKNSRCNNTNGRMGTCRPLDLSTPLWGAGAASIAWIPSSIRSSSFFP